MEGRWEKAEARHQKREKPKSATQLWTQLCGTCAGNEFYKTGSLRGQGIGPSRPKVPLKSSVAYLKNNFAEMMVFFHHAMSFDDVIDTENLLDNRHNGTVCKFR